MYITVNQPSSWAVVLILRDIAAHHTCTLMLPTSFRNYIYYCSKDEYCMQFNEVMHIAIKRLQQYSFLCMHANIQTTSQLWRCKIYKYQNARLNKKLYFLLQICYHYLPLCSMEVDISRYIATNKRGHWPQIFLGTSHFYLVPTDQGLIGC